MITNIYVLQTYFMVDLKNSFDVGDLSVLFNKFGQS